MKRANWFKRKGKRSSFAFFVRLHAWSTFFASCTPVPTTFLSLSPFNNSSHLNFTCKTGFAVYQRSRLCVAENWAQANIAGKLPSSTTLRIRCAVSDVKIAVTRLAGVSAYHRCYLEACYAAECTSFLVHVLKIEMSASIDPVFLFT